MKSYFSETLLIVILPYVMIAADVRDWVVIFVGFLSGIWIIIQIIWRLKNWKSK